MNWRAGARATWSTPTLISKPGTGRPNVLRAAVGAGGLTVVAWTSRTSLVTGNPVTGAFTAPVRLSAAADRTRTENGVHTAGGYAGPALTITRHRAVVVWEEAGTPPLARPRAPLSPLSAASVVVGHCSQT